MKKKVYIIARNHMDPSWLRCFTDHFDHPESGDAVRPYADIEELLILEYMDFAERYGVKYQIEQSLVVKKFLERNPDQKERFAALVKQGLLELAGGGETVIDVNLTRGESWARNHLYSREYYNREFGHRPRYAITPDIFGLASQLPQFFRSVGYDALIIFDRVLKNNKPYWRGLDGTCIVLDSCFLQPPEPNLRTADCVKLPACRVCRGKGCRHCEGTGVDVSYDMTRMDKELLQSAYYGNMSADTFLEKLLATEKDEYFVMITTEEPRIGQFLYGPLREAAKRHGVEVEYLTFEENHDKWCSGQVETLRSGRIPEDEIDPRTEGNPASCGCYTSRIEIKKANRELEDLLLEAETLSALVKANGGWKTDGVPRRDYPAKKLEALWNKMAFIQFHDNLPGTHCDASCEELQRYIREVRRGGLQIYRDAALEFCRFHGFAAPDGCYAAVAFNPTAEATEYPRLTLHASADVKSVRLFDRNGVPIPAFDQQITPALVGVSVSLTAKAKIPAFGWRAFFWKSSDEAETPAPVPFANGLHTIENGYFRITANDKEILEIFNKQLGRAIAGRGAGSLAAGVDVGSAWGRSEPERDHRQLSADGVTAEKTRDYSRLTLTGTVTDPTHKIKKLEWTQTVTLYAGEPLVRFRTALDWDGADTRIFVSFPPAFDPGDDLYCEVPFGTMKRNTPEMTNCLGLTDEWPTLGFAGVSNGETSMALLKGGLPAARIREGKLQLSLLRSFIAGDPKYAGAVDCGVHIADYALAAWAGAFADGDCANRAARWHTQGFTLPLTGPGLWQDPSAPAPPDAAESGTLFPALTDLPAGLRLSAFKWAENGDGPVVRFWESRGTPVTLTMPDGVLLQRLNTLEEPQTEEKTASYTFRPFEIATFRLYSR